MSKPSQKRNYSAEVRERAVRMVFEHRNEHSSRWAAIQSIAGKIGCTAQTLDGWVKQAERDKGERAGLTSDERERIRALERENRELRQANEIAVMDDAAARAPLVHSLLQRVQDEARMRRFRHAPADDAAGEHVDDESDIDEARPCRDIGEIRDPECSAPAP